MKKGLLDELVRISGCMYISDLKKKEIASGWAKFIKEIPVGKYPVSQWQEAVKYLAGDPEYQADTEEEARAYLASGKGPC